jgi:phytoene synthase
MSSLALERVPAAHLAHEVIAHHSKSFALASRLLPKDSRDDAVVLYAWCRRADDAVDGAPADHAVLARLSEELGAVYDGSASDPLLAAFGHVARSRGIPASYPRELLAGMAMDVSDARYATIDELVAYAWRVAGVVGLMMSHVLGLDDEDALVAAAHLGIAMQLTNVCRDVVEDWERERLYIPDDVLRRHGARGLAQRLGGPLPRDAHSAIRGAVGELLVLADRYYRSADRGLIALPWRAAFAIRSARQIYAAIGTEIARRDHDVIRGRAVVSRTRKLAHVASAAIRTSASGPRRLARALAGRRHTTPTRSLELADVARL